MTMKKGQPLILILMLYESNSMWKEGSAAAGFKPCMWKLSSLINPAAVGKGSGDSILA